MIVEAERAFDAAPEEVSAIDDFIADFGKRNGLHEKPVFRARVVAAELAANVLEHGGGKSGYDQISLTLACDEEGDLELTFADTTAPFDPMREGVVKADSPGGRGLVLLRGLTDVTRYWYDGRRNCVQVLFSTRASD